MKDKFKVIMLTLTGLFLVLVSVVEAQQITFTDSAELFMPGLVSTKNADVKITFSPDGKKMLWGGIDRIQDKKDMDIWQSELINSKWTEPARVTFDSDSNDFDPFFSPDGKGVYFFSNRTGGFGGDDIYFAAYNAATNTYKAAINLGDKINTKGNEWAPITDALARYLIFSSNGHGGFGGQDLFKADILSSGYGKPVNMGPEINSSDDDFDAAILPNRALVFTSAKGKEPKADLYISYKNKSYTKPVKLPAQINADDFWTFGPSVNFKEPDYLYFSSHLSHGMGRTDIYRIKYTIR
jgi:TolB protein